MWGPNIVFVCMQRNTPYVTKPFGRMSKTKKAITIIIVARRSDYFVVFHRHHCGTAVQLDIGTALCSPV